jgi:hypothetical protein
MLEKLKNFIGAKIIKEAGSWCLMPIIPATWELETGMVPA